MKKPLLTLTLLGLILYVQAQSTITTQRMSGSICAGLTFQLDYSITGGFVYYNIFVAQLSDASGSFANPDSIGAIASSGLALPITATIPASTPAGSHYRIRVIGTAPATTGADNGSDLTIDAIPAAPTLTLSNTGCLSTDTLTIAGGTAASASQLIWYLNDTTIVNSHIPYAATIAAGGNGAGSGLDQLNGPVNVFLDQAGNMYVSDIGNYRVQKFPQGSTSATNGTTVAGGNGSGGFANQTDPSSVYVTSAGYLYVANASWHDDYQFPPGSSSATSATYAGDFGLNGPSGIWVDSASRRYVADENNNRIQRFSGFAYAAGQTVEGGLTAGSGVSQLTFPTSVYFDSLKNMYVSDAGNNRIQMYPYISASDSNSTVGITRAGGNGRGLATNQLNYPDGTFIDAAGNLYVADMSNNRVLKFPAGSSSATSGITVGGGGGSGSGLNQLAANYGVQLDAQGNIYTADAGNNRIMKYSPTAMTNFCLPTLPGNYTATYVTQAGCTAPLSNQVSVVPATPPTPILTLSPASDTACMYFYDTIRATITNTAGSTISYHWYLDNSLVSSTDSAWFAFQRTTTGRDSIWVVANLNSSCYGTYSASSGKIAITTDTLVTPTVYVTASSTLLCGITTDTFRSVATNPGPSPFYQWYKNGQPVGSSTPVYIDSHVNDLDAVSLIMTVSRICSNGTVASSYPVSVRVFPTPPAPVLTLSGLGCLGSDSIILSTASPLADIIWRRNATTVDTAFAIAPATGATIAGGNDTGSAANQLYNPHGIVVDKAGNLYVADFHNNRVQMFPPGSTSATSGTTVAGGNGAGTAANQLNAPTDVKIDTSGNLYVVDQGNNRIQMFPPGSTSATNGTTVAGGNGSGSSANQFNTPGGLYINIAGDLYISDINNNRIQKFPAASTSATSGITVAGVTGTCVASAPNYVCYPNWLSLDRLGEIFVSDEGNNRIQKFPTNSSSGTSGTTVIGGLGLYYTGSAYYQIDNPAGLFADSIGDVYLADADNNRIQWYPAGSNGGGFGVVTVAGSAHATGGSADSLLKTPADVYVDRSGNIYISDAGNNRIQKWGPAKPDTTYTPASQGSYTAVYQTTGGCISPVSNTIIINPDTLPSVTVTSTLPLCNGEADTFVAHPVNGGSSPSYQWYKNGSAVGNNSSSYISTAPSNNDSVWVVLSVIRPCASPATSNKVHVNIQAQVTPAVTVGASTLTPCIGSSVSFTATPANGGAAPSYQWYNDGIAAGTNQATYTSTISTDDTVWVVLTSNASCASPLTATAAKVRVVPTAPVTPQISIALTAGSLASCAGSGPVTFTATPVYGGSSPYYTFDVNGTAVQASTNHSYTFSPADGDIVSCQLVSNAGCVATANAQSNNITLTVYPLPVPVVNRTGDVLSTGPYISYDWYDNGASIPSSDEQSIALTQTGAYYVTVIDSNGCTGTSQTIFVTALGVAALSAGSQIMVSPDPNTGSFVLETSGYIDDSYTISDILGRAIWHGVITTDKLYVSLPDNTDGVYLLSVNTSEGEKVLRFAIRK